MNLLLPGAMELFLLVFVLLLFLPSLFFSYRIAKRVDFETHHKVMWIVSLLFIPLLAIPLYLWLAPPSRKG